jgi:indolepyruvate ferredoxin oxidoreductase beta subunit
MRNTPTERGRPSTLCRGVRVSSRDAQNIILAGVGGQGILSIAKAISGRCRVRGMHVKQAEVHGMSQRGGAVQSHLRISDEPIHSDLIPAGKVDVLIAVEPLESAALRPHARA